MRYVFKITLEGLSEPKVWRRVTIPGNYTFFKFHKVIQFIFGWENLHYFEFSSENVNKEDLHICMLHIEEMDDENINVADATEITIDDVFSKGPANMLYRYDRNDNWIHEIILESADEEPLKRPKCLDGEGMCPPEGCGGAQRYENIKLLLKEHPESDEARRCREWLFMEDDDVFDPTYFPDTEIDEINDILEHS